ncbi:SH3 domain-containing protein [Gymnodinialimonas ceratoperidinii]|uniref:SH3b domain-containing protein n=1 Tax=Gymnodinialimonas ceratoperidinii TaxID=2856823 RepID=A0A8F6TYT9_9RHOB|nr:hypothetical protein [Gymnodinialimonas ceratoperidinii]QXT40669.1 hypothetical protein KYE46_05375 [Gymnodinialimonas ceratoperidinii]
MRIFKAFALAMTAALTLAAGASAGGTAQGAHPNVQTFYAPGSGHGAVAVNYHTQGQPPQGGHGNDGHGPDFYRVHGVAYHDHLNVRHGPGVRNHVVDRLPYNARGIQLGTCAQISTTRGPATWCIVSWNGYQRGWVNARYLAEDNY